ncbi:MAG: WD40/YVTN/BNR-like repeat-containing protein [Chitinispirillaceae bacterium]
MKNRIISTSVLYLFTSIAAAGETQSPYHLDKQIIFCTSVTSSQKGWAVGRPSRDEKNATLQGTLLHTEDGGITWKKMTVPVVEQFTSVHFIDDIRGWVVSSEGSILNTNNGGKKWVITAVLEAELRSVVFTDSANGWVCGTAPCSSETSEHKKTGVVFSTCDGGHSWEKKVIWPHTGPINSIFFFGKNGWAAGVVHKGSLKIGAIFHSDDSGNSWELQFTTEPDSYFLHIEFGTEKKGKAVSYCPKGTRKGSHLFRTEDGGKSWHAE